MRTGQYEEAFWELNMAATLSDDLVYDEPWGWMQPPLHALGARRATKRPAAKRAHRASTLCWTSSRS